VPLYEPAVCALGSENEPPTVKVAVADVPAVPAKTAVVALGVNETESAVPGPVIETVESTVMAALLFAVPVMVKPAAVAPVPKQVELVQVRTPAVVTATVPVAAPGKTLPKLRFAVFATLIGARMTAEAVAVVAFAA